jgi:hypothetical protein
MSLYALQKLIRDVNRRPQCRDAYFKAPATFADGYDLAERERDALLKLDMGTLYGMGVHGLLLRPFTILHKVAESDYPRRSEESSDADHVCGCDQPRSRDA